MNKILSCDQSTTCSGISCFVNGQYQWTKLVDLKKEKDSELRFKHMVTRIYKIIEKEKPDEIVFEQTTFQSNAKTLRMLSQLQGCIIGKCFELDIPYYILEPSKWRKTVGIEQGKKTRTSLKFESLNLAHELFSKELTEDAAESALIGCAHLILNHNATMEDFSGEDLF